MSYCSKYESAFAELFGAKRAFAFWKGRVAMYAILKALGVKAGDEVILPGYTCVMNVNPIKYLGAKPVYVDIEPNMFNMNPALLEGKITLRTKIIVAQHTYGYPCDMEAIMSIAVKRGIVVIEDCCLAFGSKYKGRTVGTFGKASYFSFQWNKSYTTGLGGMVLTDDSTLADKIGSICANEMHLPAIKQVAILWLQLAVYRLFIYPRTTTLARNLFTYLTKIGITVGSSDKGEFEPVIDAGFFKAMSCVQARSGLRQLKNIEENKAHRIQMAHLYDELLQKNGWYGRKYDKSVIDPVMVRYPIRIAEKNRAINNAVKAGIELGNWFECPLHPIETQLQAYDYQIGMCPKAEEASREVVNLPLHPGVSEKVVKKTVEFITKFTQVVKTNSNYASL